MQDPVPFPEEALDPTGPDAGGDEDWETADLGADDEDDFDENDLGEDDFDEDEDFDDDLDDEDLDDEELDDDDLDDELEELEEQWNVWGDDDPHDRRHRRDSEW